MGKLSRTKGHSFERLIANRLKCIFPEAKRQLEYQIDDCVGVDIANTGVFKIQCKKYKKYVHISKIKEVICNREFGEIPVLITAGDHAEPMVVIPLEDFIELVKSFV